MASSAGDSTDFRTETGGFIPGTDRPAYMLSGPASPPIPVLIGVPHAGRDYPSSVLADMRDPEFASLKLEDRMVDEVAREIAQLTGATLLVAQAPRAMLDLNRARDDIDWDMIRGQRPHPARHSQANRRARSGLGLVPRRLPGFGEIWRGLTDRNEINARIEGIHRPYHAALAGELSRIRDLWGCALLIDIHSMPPLRAPSVEQEAPRFVIGDRFGTSCSASLVSHGYRYLDCRGKPVAHNRPYAGGYILETHGAPSRGVHALQLEICRTTYLDARLEQPSARIGPLAKLLAGLVRELGVLAAELGPASHFSQAAE